MILAGGNGLRLGELTAQLAKPVVSFGGKFRMIDFALSNCLNSNLDTVGVLAQYNSDTVLRYISKGSTWNRRGIQLLPPDESSGGAGLYKSTADAVYKNIDFIKEEQPTQVLVVSADQIYQMDYRNLIKEHNSNNAELTIAVTPVSNKDATRMGIVTLDDKNRITDFVEKPENPPSNLASMGIYLFQTDVLLSALEADAKNADSSHDFGKDVIPYLLKQQCRMYAYKFEDYWCDVGTIPSYYEASMRMIDKNTTINPDDIFMPVRTNATAFPPAQIDEAYVSHSLLADGCVVSGTVKHSIVSHDAQIFPDAVVEDSILLPGAIVKEGAHIIRTIVGESAVVEAGACVGSADLSKDIAVVSTTSIKAEKIRVHS